MKKLLLLVPILFSLYSCGSSLKLKGDYPDINSYFTETTDSYDQVWDRIIDFFAISGVPISNIDKESGLIVSSKFSFINNYTREVGGKPLNPDAYVVIPTVRGALFFNILEPTAVITGSWIMEGDFNVRIKKIKGDLTSINVNLVNLICIYNWDRIPMKSTGIFEKSLIELFKADK